MCAALWRLATLHAALFAYLFVSTNMYICTMHNVVCSGVLEQKIQKGELSNNRCNNNNNNNYYYYYTEL